LFQSLRSFTDACLGLTPLPDTPGITEIRASDVAERDQHR
jgi:hypothetical protein